MATLHHRPESYVSDAEVTHWIEEAQRIDQRRSRSLDGRLFWLTCAMFVLLLLGYVVFAALDII